jgi:hypothetical protein
MNNDVLELTDPTRYTDAPPPGYVRRHGRYFRLGHYPQNKNFSLNAEEADRAIAIFKPVLANLEHRSTVLDGKVGVLRTIWREGEEIHGLADVPEWLHAILGPDERAVSCEWDVNTKTLEGWGYVLEPAITDAALFAAHATFAAKQAAAQRNSQSRPEVSQPGAVNTTGTPTQDQRNMRKRRFNMTLAEKLLARMGGKAGQEAPPASQPDTAAFTGVNAINTIDQLLPTLQRLAQSDPQGFQNALAGFSAPGATPQNATSGLESHGEGREGEGLIEDTGGTTAAPQNGSQSVAAFAAPGYMGEPMEEGVADFKAEQIVTRAEETVERLISEGHLHQYGREAALAAFTLAGYDNEASGPSLVTFARADGKVLTDRVAILMEVLAATPTHSLFSKVMPVQVYNGSPDPARSGPADAGVAQAQKANEEMYGHLLAQHPELAQYMPPKSGQNGH